MDSILIAYFAVEERSSVTAKVAKRGQVTIPKQLRAKLGIGPGTVLEFNTRKAL
jgi:AbrB family looped-hinge helix DNA binding protein